MSNIYTRNRSKWQYQYKIDLTSQSDWQVLQYIDYARVYKKDKYFTNIQLPDWRKYNNLGADPGAVEIQSS